MLFRSIKSIRNVRTQMNVPPKKKAKVMVFISENTAEAAFKEGEDYFKKLAGASSVEFLKNKEDIDVKVVSCVTRGAEMFIPLLDLIEIDVELERLNSEIKKLKDEISRIQKKLANEKFVSKAPAKVVAEEKAKGEKYTQMLKSVEERIQSLTNKN